MEEASALTFGMLLFYIQGFLKECHLFTYFFGHSVNQTLISKFIIFNWYLLGTNAIIFLISLQSNACAENEVCCQLPSASKSSLADHVNQLVFAPGKSKFTGKDGLTPEQVQVSSLHQ